MHVNGRNKKCFFVDKCLRISRVIAGMVGKRHFDVYVLILGAK